VSDINGLYRYIVQILRRTVEAVRENRTKPIVVEIPREEPLVFIHLATDGELATISLAPQA
jgi:vacuolar-type H+-ATPase subunit F/Vma7